MSTFTSKQQAMVDLFQKHTVLNQLGLLDPKGLPICGAESAQKILSFLDQK